MIASNVGLAVAVFTVGGLIGLGLVVIDAAMKPRAARQPVAPQTLLFGPTNEGPEVELPAYEPGPCDRQFPAGVETDIRQALAIAADEIDPAAVQRIRTAVMDEVGRRREHKAGVR